MPSPSTWPKGVKPWESSEEPLSFRLMKSCVVRVLAPAVAKTRGPGLLDWLWGSSGVVAFSQAALTAGLGLEGRWAGEGGRARKKREVLGWWCFPRMLKWASPRRVG